MCYRKSCPRKGIQSHRPLIQFRCRRTGKRPNEPAVADRAAACRVILLRGSGHSRSDGIGIPQLSQPDKLGHNETRGRRRFWPSSLIRRTPLKPRGIPPVLQRLLLLKEPSSEIVLCPSLISFGIRPRD